MKYTLSLCAFVAIALTLSVPVSAQRRGIAGGALVLDDYHGNNITMETPQYNTPEWLAWQAAGFPSLWIAPVPPTSGAQAGFIYSGPLTPGGDLHAPPAEPTPYYFAYWVAPGYQGIHNIGGAAGAWDYGSSAELGIVSENGLAANDIPKWDGSQFVPSSMTDNGSTISSAESLSVDGIDNNAGGITSAGAISGATGISSSGTITFSGLTASSVVMTDGSSDLTTGQVNLTTQVTNVLPVANGGTGAATVAGVNQFFANTTANSAPGFRSIANTDLPGSGAITVTGGTGLGVSGSPVALGGTLTLSNTGVTSDVAGTGISVNNGGVGAVTITNTGVTSFTAGDVLYATETAATGAVTTPALNTQTAARVFAGPVSGGALAPTFRALANTDLPGSGAITVTGGTGLGVSGSPVALGGTLTLSNTGVTSDVAGTGISVNNGGVGAVTITNTGVTSFTAGDVLYATETAATGAVTTPALNTQTAARVFAGPVSGGALAPTFRALANTDLPGSGAITVTGGTGLGVSGSPVALGGTLTLSNTGVTSDVAGTGISVNNGGVGAVTITNTGVTSFTAGDVLYATETAATGAVTTPALNTQSPNTVLAGPATGVTSATPTFRQIVAADITGGLPYLPLAGGTMLGNITMGTNNINGTGSITATTITAGTTSATGSVTAGSVVGESSLTAGTNGAVGAKKGQILLNDGTNTGNTITIQPGALTASYQLGIPGIVPITNEYSNNATARMVLIESPAGPGPGAGGQVIFYGPSGNTARLDWMPDQSDSMVTTSVLGNGVPGGTYLTATLTSLGLSGGGHVGSISTSLGQPTAYTLPDPGTSTATIALRSDIPSPTNYVQTAPTAAQSITPATDFVPLTIKNASGGTSDILDLQDGSGNSVASFSPGTNGLTLGGTAGTMQGILRLYNGAGTKVFTIAPTGNNVKLNTDFTAEGSLTTGKNTKAGALFINDGAGNSATLDAPNATNNPVFDLPAESDAGPYTLATTADLSSLPGFVHFDVTSGQTSTDHNYAFILNDAPTSAAAEGGLINSTGGTTSGDSATGLTVNADASAGGDIATGLYVSATGGGHENRAIVANGQIDITSSDYDIYGDSWNVDHLGNITATSFSGPLTGNVTGNVSGTASNVTGLVAVANGGTGAATVASANQFFANTTAGSAPAFRSIAPTDVQFAVTTTTDAPYTALNSDYFIVVNTGGTGVAWPASPTPGETLIIENATAVALATGNFAVPPGTTWHLFYDGANWQLIN